ncbi:uncharacterized protein LOC129905960 [Episyrphus balteatus]|uniref:uncharacterized protein LOC129905960 n=1 Tax=Episyrphus balteatus TaxID=286459 RepID=UPI002485234A|nr:uncharacterized protein LOC129905960 [Episyrphus balteatus]
MNCIIILSIIACALNASLASGSHHKAEKAHSAVMSHVAEKMGSVRMMRSNRVHLECYNGFLPLINSLALKAKENSNLCVKDADNKKDIVSANLNSTEVAAAVKQITDSLEDCSNQKGLEYFVCLSNNADKNLQLLEIIKTKSQQMLQQNTVEVGQIDSDEHSCIMDAVDKAKNESDLAFGKLKSCINGEATFDEVEQDDAVEA